MPNLVICEVRQESLAHTYSSSEEDSSSSFSRITAGIFTGIEDQLPGEIFLAWRVSVSPWHLTLT
ncbi:hypothetical protein EYF80_036828 [Liparis tanakae]|uniref:Uncharacterized protein n=1 Tax=Liparis tanakae TaxID=230148 RepID=A0A4Z2GJA4_9TELE|nr:hypothetical protein EYF80_036828 [Liparis tanakae]